MIIGDRAILNEKELMINVTILALDQSVPSGVLIAYDLFRMAEFTQQKGAPPLFQVSIVTENGQCIDRFGVISIKPHSSIAQATKPDVILIPSGGYSIKGLTGYSKHLTQWLRSMHDRGTDIAGMCTGVFLLAESGILSGKKATTHWAYADFFRMRFPDVILSADDMITRDNHVFCSGGGSAGLDLMLYLIEKYHGPSCAKRCAAMMVLDRGRDVQTPYREALLEKNHADEPILKAQLFMEQNLGGNLLLNDVASHVGMSLRNFKRRFKNATGDSPLMYLQRLRMEKAKHILERRKPRIEDLASSVGYEDLGFFRKLFTRYTGVSPSDYRKRFRNSLQDETAY